MNSMSVVAVARCASYDAGEVRAAVGRALDLLGGMGRFVVPGAGLLLKPNMLAPQPPEKAVTTHPAIVAAAASLAREAGASPRIGDSPGFHSFAKAAAASGIAAMAAAGRIPLVPFDDGEEIRTPPGGLVSSFVVSRAAARAPAIVSLPKFKTHNLTGITASVKNLFGCIPGLRKAEFHCRFPDADRFAAMLVDLAFALPARLHILDAVVAMDGDGPGAGDPFPLGLVIAGGDPVAVDSTACRAAGIDPLSIPMLRIAAERGLGTARADGIEIRGDTPAATPGFRAPAAGGGKGPAILPDPVARAVKGWFARRPRVDRGLCTLCGACAGVCPARPKAISIRGGRVAIDDRRCILCYCCSEICPSRAIRLRRGRGAGLLARALGI